MVNEGKFKGADSEREKDPQWVQFKGLFDMREDEFGRDPVLKYIDSKKGIAKKVILGWLDGIHTPETGTRRDILSCLRNLRPGDLPKSEKDRLPNSNIAKLTLDEWLALEKKLKDEGQIK